MEDFKLLLNEYNRAVSSNPNFTDSPALIPLLLKHGAFTPSRLEKWPFALVLEEMNKDEVYRSEMVESFKKLVKNLDHNTNSFNLNEKKAVSFLLAARDSFPQILNHLSFAIGTNLRILLACLEYGVFTVTLDLRSMVAYLPLPLDSNLLELAPKFKLKYPRLAIMLTNPSITIAQGALSFSIDNNENLFEQKFILDCAARYLDSRTLYDELIVPVWNTDVAPIVLDSMKFNQDLISFCNAYINK